MKKVRWRKQKVYFLLFMAWAVIYFLYKMDVPDFFIVSTVVLVIALMLLLNRLIFIRKDGLRGK